MDRWRELAEPPLDRMQLRLQFEAAEATIEALAHLRLIMSSATKRVLTPTGIQQEPDWRKQLKAARLVLTRAFAAIPDFRAGASQASPDGRTLRAGVRVTECEHDFRPNSPANRFTEPKTLLRPVNASSECGAKRELSLTGLVVNARSS